MSEITVHELSKKLISRANSNSMNGKRGNLSNDNYQSYAETIVGWPISTGKKQRLLDKLYEKWSVILRHEAQHVSVAVAGPANYNSKRLDHGDTILRLHSELYEWFKKLEEQVRRADNGDDEIDTLLSDIYFRDERDELDPTNKLIELAFKGNARFIELYEELAPKYRWRKNSKIHKVYERSKAGEIGEVKRELFFEDENFTAYRMSDRAYIKFLMRPARQLIVALKSRGYWWNNRENAWSTYLDRVDEDWVKTISERYGKYV